MNDSAINCFDAHWSDLGQRVSYAVDVYILPFYFFLGVVGHGFCLVAFFTRGKTKRVIFFKFLFLLVNCSALLLVPQLLTNYWQGVKRPPSPWYSACYTCKWAQAHMTVFIDAACTTMIQLLCACMACDRYSALRHATKYKSITKRGYLVMPFTCVVISLATALNLALLQEVRIVPKLSNENVTMYV